MQTGRRQLERRVKRAALAFARWAGRLGEPVADTAERLGLSVWTLNAWRERWAEDRLAIRRRGRSRVAMPRRHRRAFFAIYGMYLPVAPLRYFQELFPDVPHNGLLRLWKRCRYAWRRRGPVQFQDTLRWAKPGTVWAMDFTQTPTPVDRCYPYVLVVNDLASGSILHQQPCESPCATLARDVLALLFAAHGAPLVIKSDNGSAFIADGLAPLLEAHDVIALFSPPGTPRFNGACEVRRLDQVTRLPSGGSPG